MFRPLHLVPANTRIDFMRFHKWCFAISVIMVVGSLVLVATKGLNFGIDFSGGILIEVKSEGPADLGHMREAIGGLGLGEVALQEFGGADSVLIRVQRQEGDEQAQIRAVDSIKTALGGGLEYRRTEYVGPKVGGELISTAIWAVVIALGGIAAYIWFRYEWQFAVNAIAATLHDCITTVGLFSLLGLDFNLTTVAAVLTIAGYSVNDTVVVYDRVRSEMRRYKKMPMTELINLSVNRTLSRTTVTSGLTLVSVLALFFFGGEVLSGLSTALIWGIVVGTYSTIFVATPMLIYMHVRASGAVPEKTGGEKADDEKAAAPDAKAP